MASFRLDFNYEPTEKQLAFHRASQRFRAYVGGMGSGKTHAGIFQTLQIATAWQRNLILIGRATYPELRDSTRKDFLDFPVIVDGKEMPLVASPLVKNWNKSENHLLLWNGTEILFRALEDSFDKIKSLNLGAFWVDELTEIPEEMWLGLVGRLRRKGVRHFGIGTTNPEGHDWVWKRFYAQPDSDHVCIQASSHDNPYLPDGYIQSMLSNFPEEWVKRYVLGSFDTFSGLIYHEFRDEPPLVIERREIPDTWNRFVAIDYGYRNPTAVLWFAVSPKGHAFVYDEFYASGKLISGTCEIIKTKNGGQRIQMYLGDPSMRNTTGVSGRSILDEFAEGGIIIQPANNSVQAGINRVKERMGKKTLSIFRDCVNLRTEIQTYKWKDLKPGATQDGPEKPVKKNDHAVDALRYGVSFLYDTPAKPEKPYAFDYTKAESNEPSHWMAA